MLGGSVMGSARLVFGFGGHGQRRQRREGGGEQPPQLQGTVEDNSASYKNIFITLCKYVSSSLLEVYKLLNI